MNYDLVIPCINTFYYNINLFSVFDKIILSFKRASFINMYYKKNIICILFSYSILNLKFYMNYIYITYILFPYTSLFIITLYTLRIITFPLKKRNFCVNNVRPTSTNATCLLKSKKSQKNVHRYIKKNLCNVLSLLR